MENNNKKNLTIIGETSPECFVNVLRKDHNSVWSYVICGLIFAVCFMIKAIAAIIKLSVFMAKKAFIALLNVYKKDEE